MVLDICVFVCTVLCHSESMLLLEKPYNRDGKRYRELIQDIKKFVNTVLLRATQQELQLGPVIIGTVREHARAKDMDDKYA